MAEAEVSNYRLFIALPLPAAIRQAAAAPQDELRSQLSADALRWTSPEQLHLTLRFLGNVPSDCVGELKSQLETACRRFSPFEVQAERVGFFPDEGTPRIVWIALENNEGALQKIKTAVDAATAGHGSKATEARFTPHVTIARVKRIKRSEATLLKVWSQRHSKTLLGRWTADSILLMRSQLSPQGSRYLVLATIPLGVIDCSSPASAS